MQPLPQPELPKFIVCNSGKYKYVFTYKNRWDPKTKRAWRGKGDTKCVGKLIEVQGKDNCGEIIFNQQFIADHPEVEHLRVFRYKGGRLEFEPIDEQVHNVMRPDKIERLHAGATWALHQIVGSSVLGKTLKQLFPDYKTYLRLLSLAYYLVINKDSSLCNFEEFAECTWLPYARGQTSGCISRLLQKINKDKISRFLSKLNQNYVKEQGEGISERKFWALDSTSITSYSENISSVQYGHNKDLMDAPQTNVLMIVDQKTGEPVYYRNFDGNVPDVSTVRNTLAELAMMKVDTQNVVLVTDRGYGSSKNWDDMLRNNMSFVSNARRNLNSLITELIDENYSKLLDWNHAVSFLNQSAVTVPVQWHYDEFPVLNKRSRKNAQKTLYIHLYYSKTLNDTASESLRTRLLEAIGQQETNPKALTQEQQRLLNEYTVEKDGKSEISMANVDKKLRYAGVRVLVSDVIDDALECAVAYEERNQVEYAFNVLKSKLACNRTRAHSSGAWEGRLFLQILATAIGTMVRSRVKMYNQTAAQKSYRMYYDSDVKLLAKLNNVYMTKFNNGWIFDEVVGKKKELFKILSVPLPSAEQVFERQYEKEEPDHSLDYEESLLGISGTDALEDL